MKNFLIGFLLLGSLSECGQASPNEPEKHLKLGQPLTFVGAEPGKTYVVVGYRHLLEDKTDKQWSNHDYIVVSYSNNQGEIKHVAIHKNSILNE